MDWEPWEWRFVVVEAGGDPLLLLLAAIYRPSRIGPAAEERAEEADRGPAISAQYIECARSECSIRP